MSSTIGVRQIDHVTLVSANLQRSEAFYVELLGMQKVPRPNFSFNGRWFQAGQTLIHLIEVHEQTGPAGPGRTQANRATREAHLAFSIQDMDLAHQLVLKADVSIVSGPKKRPDGASQLFILDPDEYLIELCTDPE